MQWSLEQQAIFEQGSKPGNLAIRARAGTGKTTTIVELAKRLTVKGAPFDRRKVVFCAFNASIAKQLLEARLPSSVSAKTLHSLGLGAIKKAGINAKVDQYKNAAMCKRIEREDSVSLYGYTGRINQLVSWGKNAGMVPGDCQPQLASHAENLGLDDEDMSASRLASLADRVLAYSLTYLSTIDFDDMLWVPYVKRLLPYTFDLVLIDEAQDLNAIQHWLASTLLAKGGKVVIVGDDRQAIYQWRGAFDGSFDELASQFKATIMPLTITRRCPKKVVSLANVYVPDFRAAEDAPQGTVTHAQALDVTTLKNGDAVISRVNAPLMDLCLQVLLAGKRARVMGADIGKQLVALVNKSKATDCEGVFNWSVYYLTKQQDRLAGKDDTAFEKTVDLVMTLQTLTKAAVDLAHLRAMLDTLFVGTRKADDCITFTTAHRSKGLEFDRVFVLRDTFKGLGGDNLAEHNVYYVAITRTKQHLTVVCGE